MLNKKLLSFLIIIFLFLNEIKGIHHSILKKSLKIKKNNVVKEFYKPYISVLSKDNNKHSFKSFLNLFANDLMEKVKILFLIFFKPTLLTLSPNNLIEILKNLSEKFSDKIRSLFYNIYKYVFFFEGDDDNLLEQIQNISKLLDNYPINSSLISFLEINKNRINFPKITQIIKVIRGMVSAIATTVSFCRKDNGIGENIGTLGKMKKELGITTKSDKEYCNRFNELKCGYGNVVNNQCLEVIKNYDKLNRKSITMVIFFGIGIIIPALTLLSGVVSIIKIDKDNSPIHTELKKTISSYKYNNEEKSKLEKIISHEINESKKSFENYQNRNNPINLENNYENNILRLNTQ